jgi:hypothetical protein
MFYLLKKISKKDNIDSADSWNGNKKNVEM